MFQICGLCEIQTLKQQDPKVPRGLADVYSLNQNRGRCHFGSSNKLLFVPPPPLFYSAYVFFLVEAIPLCGCAAVRAGPCAFPFFLSQCFKPQFQGLCVI